MSTNSHPASLDPISSAMHSSEELVICAVCDDGYALPTTITLRSALNHLADGIPVRIFLLDAGLSDKNRDRLSRILLTTRPSVSLDWITASQELHDVQTYGHLTEASLLRLTLPSALSEEIEKVIYLDGDFLIQRDLGLLWREDFNNCAILAAQDFMYPDLQGPLARLYQAHPDLNIYLHAPYFNAGLLVLDVQRIRREDSFNEAIRFAKQYGEFLPYADQDCLNALLIGDWQELDPRWNVQVPFVRHPRYWKNSAVRDALDASTDSYIDDAYAIHFSGPRKPWRRGVLDPYSRLYRAHLRQSTWFGRWGYLKWYAGLLKRTLRYNIKLVLEKVRNLGSV